MVVIGPRSALVVRPSAAVKIKVVAGEANVMDDREMMRRWVQTWKEAGPLLEEIRREEVREADNVQVVALLEDAFKDAVRRLPQRESSGLVEMQKWFAKMR